MEKFPGIIDFENWLKFPSSYILRRNYEAIADDTLGSYITCIPHGRYVHDWPTVPTSRNTEYHSLSGLPEKKSESNHSHKLS
jgi:hypothetical protein